MLRKFPLLLLLSWACAAGAGSPPEPVAAEVPAAPPAPDAGAPAPPAGAAPEALPAAEPAWEVRLKQELATHDYPPWLDLSRQSGTRIAWSEIQVHLLGAKARALRGLDLSGQEVHFQGAKAIGASAYLEGLVELRLRGAGLGDNGVRAIAYSRGLPSLRRLDLSENGAAEIATEAVCESRYLGQLTHLDLRGNAPPPPAAARKLGVGLVAVEVLRVDADWPAPVLAALREGLGDRVGALQHEAPAD